jgi:hypothetical protein
MKIFVSWSGEKSQRIAVALHEWLPTVLNSVEPFMSANIEPGARWQSELAAELEGCSYGIVCVTQQNQSSAWLNFEAGALTKAVKASRVVPLLIDLTPSDIKPPLAQFQAQEPTKEGMHAIVTAINDASPSARREQLVERSFETCWTTLASRFEEIFSASPVESEPHRTERELLEETVETVRSLARAAWSTPFPLLSEEQLPEDHPLVEELEQLLSGLGCEILFRMGSRELAIVSKSELSSDLQESVRTQAGIYAVGIVFTPEDSGQITR